MKTPHGAASNSPSKWRWRWFFAAAFVALIFFSLLVPLFVLLGLHNIFPYGHLMQNRVSQSETNLGLSGSTIIGSWETNGSQAESNNSRIGSPVKKFAATFVEEEKGNLTSQFNETSKITSSSAEDDNNTTYQRPSSKVHTIINSEERLYLNKTETDINETGNYQKNMLSGGQNVKSCQLKFGSYCTWYEENKQKMKDSTVKRIKDQLFVARAYYPTIVKLNETSKLALEMRQRIQVYEQMLNKVISDLDLPNFVAEMIEKMDETIAKAKSCDVNCHNVDKKLQQLLDMTEDEAHFHMKQSAYLYQLNVQTLLKSYHCLALRLTVRYFNSLSEDLAVLHADKLEDPNLRHYVLFSRNIISTAVTVNSTVMNSEDPDNMVFHLITDRQNFYAFKSWFSSQSYKGASFQIFNIEDSQFKNKYSNLSTQNLSPSEEFRISFSRTDQEAQVERTEYLSVFGHSHFSLPDLLENIPKVVVLDDDVVVQKDLSSLWNFDLGGKVIGAVQCCGVRLGQIKNYIGEFRYDSDSCAWMSGLNIVDLEKWRELDISSMYSRLLQRFEGMNEESWRIGTLRASLLAFHDLVQPLQTEWIQSGLGHDYKLAHGRIRKALALHFDGSMKPWLHLGILRYKKYWRKYFPRDDPFMAECNINP
ncbi:Hexosyltransferase [Rhynchospora pubera]|uniref:Hexosyltransferase n=1 Tax=Rhynchospora pubera TaxID=906938 RepID=A0AAV8DGE5_9POAL|nr:Hexosyltransferase [Rhynchospora pubera]